MIVFKYYFKIIRNYLPFIILYSGITLIFAIFFSTQNQSNTASFIDSKPKIGIINNDKGKLADALVDYLNNNTTIVNADNYQDAMFYRDIYAVVTIPKGFSSSFLEQEKVFIDINKTEDISANQIELLINKFLKIAKAYVTSGFEEEEVVQGIKKDISDSVIVEVLAKESSNEKYLVAYLYSFSSYSILAICISGIGIIMLSYNKKGIRSRNSISPVSYSRFNLSIISGHLIFTICIWLLFNITALIIYPGVVLSKVGILFVINSFLYCLVSLAIGFLCGKLINNRNVNLAVMNVLALGSSFLSGAFVPQSLLSDGVLKISHFIPAYWFVKSNDLIAQSSTLDSKVMNQFFSNSAILIIFVVILIVLSNIVSKYKQKA